MEETSLLLRFVGAFVLVMSMMGGLWWFMKRLGLSGRSLAAGPPRLKIIEYLPLDHRRRLVLVRCDEKEHLLVLGVNGETVVQTNMPAQYNIVDFLSEKEQRSAGDKNAGE